MRWLGVFATVAGVLVAGALSASPASAFGSNGSGGSGTPSGTGGRSGDSAQTTYKSCSLYASSGSFGLACYSGGGAHGKVKTVGDVLGKEHVPQCWDEAISNEDLAKVYQYQPNPDAPYYVETCVKNLTKATPLGQAPDIDHQVVLEIPKDAKKCGTGPSQVGLLDLSKICVQTLTDKQAQVVRLGDPANRNIPGITLEIHPSTRVRTNVDTAFQDGASADGGTVTRTDNLRVGGVTMWAEMTGYSIHPAGTGGPSKACDPAVAVGPTDDRSSPGKGGACWWKYAESSTNEHDSVFDFRSEARWAVCYADDAPAGAPAAVNSGAAPCQGGRQLGGAFVQDSDLPLPVLDVQSIVVH